MYSHIQQQTIYLTIANDGDCIRKLNKIFLKVTLQQTVHRYSALSGVSL